jgi:hypothetical protein
LAFVVACAFLILRLYPVDEGRIETVRSFFGVHKIFEADGGLFRILQHGTTVHGAQKLRTPTGAPEQGRPEPLTYYHRSSPMAETIRAVRDRKAGPLRVAVIGLGAGSLSCYIEPGESWRFFEIDPTVVAIARDPARFTFLSSCAPDVPIVLGDARLTLAREPDRTFDLIIVDAYTSDTVPIHLATREAMAIYKAKLATDGVVLMHISNRHLDLGGVVVGIAAANGMKTWICDDFGRDNEDDDYVFSSDVAISAVKADDIGAMNASQICTLTEPEPGERTWTDDYSNILGAIWRKYN